MLLLLWLYVLGCCLFLVVVFANENHLIPSVDTIFASYFATNFFKLQTYSNVIFVNESSDVVVVVVAVVDLVQGAA